MDPLSDTTGFMGIFSSIILVAAALAYVIPVGFLGIVLYYFTGEKKSGTGLMHNLMNTSVRLYSYSWMFIASIITLIASSSVLSYILKNIFDTDDKPEDSSPFLSGVLYLTLALIIFAIHFVLNYVVSNPVQKKGSVMTKMFIGIGLIVYSSVAFFSILGIINAIVSDVYNKYSSNDFTGAFSVLLASTVLWAVYVYKAISIYRNENK